MKQSFLSERVCQLHQKKVVFLCFSATCNQSRLICFDCIVNDLHFGHQQRFKQYQDSEEIFYKLRQKCNHALQNLNEMIDGLLLPFYMLKKGIENKYNLSLERLNLISNDQFNQYISNTNLFDEQYYSEDFANKLKNQVIELQLDDLNYLEISREDEYQAEQMFNIGYALYWNEQDYNKAIKLFDQALIYNHNHQLSLQCKGESLCFIGQYNESIESYDKTLTLDPKNVNALFGKAQSLRLLGKFKESIDWYNKSLAVNPQHLNSLHGKGGALRLIGQYQQSIEWYDQALIIDPYHLYSLIAKGEALRLLGQFSESTSNRQSKCVFIFWERRIINISWLILDLN